jgi:2-phospho-L-lactate guanylyltransferase
MDLLGTVRTFERAESTGSVLLDDGTTLLFDAAAFHAGGLRLLRPGQRVRLRTVAGRVIAVTLGTFQFADTSGRAEPVEPAEAAPPGP